MRRNLTHEIKIVVHTCHSQYHKNQQMGLSICTWFAFVCLDIKQQLWSYTFQSQDNVRTVHVLLTSDEAENRALWVCIWLSSPLHRSYHCKRWFNEWYSVGMIWCSSWKRDLQVNPTVQQSQFSAQNPRPRDINIYCKFWKIWISLDFVYQDKVFGFSTTIEPCRMHLITFKFLGE